MNADSFLGQAIDFKLLKRECVVSSIDQGFKLSKEGKSAIEELSMISAVFYADKKYMPNPLQSYETCVKISKLQYEKEFEEFTQNLSRGFNRIIKHLFNKFEEEKREDLKSQLKNEIKGVLDVLRELSEGSMEEVPGAISSFSEENLDLCQDYVMDLYKNQQFTEAIECLRALIILDSSRYGFHLALGASLQEIGSYKEAIIAYAIATEKNGDHPLAYIQMAFSYAELKEKEAAVECFEIVTEIMEEEPGKWDEYVDQYESCKLRIEKI
jgi:tetratricopeptide (TPR) repeat protein